MLRVETSNPTYQKQLQQDYHIQNGYYMIPSKQNQVIAKLIQSISYESFHQKQPEIVQKFNKIMIAALNSTFQLTEYRQLTMKLKKMFETQNNLRQYFSVMSKQIDQQDDLSSASKVSLSDSRDYLFQQAQLGLRHNVQTLETVKLQQSILSIQINKEQENQFDLKVQCVQNTHITSSFSSMCDVQPESMLQKLSSFLSQNTGRNWQKQWLKGDSHISKQSSKQIQSFNKKSPRLLSTNSNFKSMIYDQIRYDINRQRHIHKQQKKQENVDFLNDNHNNTVKSVPLGMPLGWKLKYRRKP